MNFTIAESITEDAAWTAFLQDVGYDTASLIVSMCPDEAGILEDTSGAEPTWAVADQSAYDCLVQGAQAYKKKVK